MKKHEEVEIEKNYLEINIKGHQISYPRILYEASNCNLSVYYSLAMVYINIYIFIALQTPSVLKKATRIGTRRLGWTITPSRLD